MKPAVMVVGAMGVWWVRLVYAHLLSQTKLRKPMFRRKQENVDLEVAPMPPSRLHNLEAAWIALQLFVCLNPMVEIAARLISFLGQEFFGKIAVIFRKAAVANLSISRWISNQNPTFKQITFREKMVNGWRVEKKYFGALVSLCIHSNQLGLYGNLASPLDPPIWSPRKFWLFWAIIGPNPPCKYFLFSSGTIFVPFS